MRIGSGWPRLRRNTSCAKFCDGFKAPFQLCNFLRLSALIICHPEAVTFDPVNAFIRAHKPPNKFLCTRIIIENLGTLYRRQNEIAVVGRLITPKHHRYIRKRLRPLFHIEGRPFGQVGTNLRKAEFEADIRRDRQRDGIERAKAKGVYRGRKPSIDTARIETLMAAGMAPAAIAREMGVGRASVYRHMGKAAAT